MDRFNSIRDYREKLERFDEDIEPYSMNPAHLCASILTHSDYSLELQGMTEQAYRDRYEFREGAAAMFAEVFGYDLDMARSLMMTHQAWEDYKRTWSNGTAFMECMKQTEKE